MVTTQSTMSEQEDNPIEQIQQNEQIQPTLYERLLTVQFPVILNNHSKLSFQIVLK